MFSIFKRKKTQYFISGEFVTEDGKAYNFFDTFTSTAKRIDLEEVKKYYLRTSGGDGYEIKKETLHITTLNKL